MVTGMKLGAGTLYIGHPGDDNLVPLGEVAAGGLVEAVEVRDAYAIDHIITNLQEKATFTVHVSKTQIDNLMVEVFGFKKMALDQMRESGHGRIAHLATRARKRKTRKKNLHRAYSALRIP
jgi:hypothetical protein